jgi:hypothetical protein
MKNAVTSAASVTAASDCDRFLAGYRDCAADAETIGRGAAETTVGKASRAARPPATRIWGARQLGQNGTPSSTAAPHW